MLLGQTGPTDLARLVKLEGQHAPKRAERWLSGAARPNFEAALLMLDSAGLLQAEAVGALHGLNELGAAERVAEMRAAASERVEAAKHARQVRDAEDKARAREAAPARGRRAAGGGA